MNQSKHRSGQPYWLWQTKRLFPHPVFAGCISFACLLVTILFAGVAISERIWPMGIASAIFLAGTCATAAAAFTGTKDKRSANQQDSTHPQAYKPTFAVLVLLIGVYSWLLTIAMHVFDTFFKNGPGSLKYFVTLGIAVAATLFMQVYGKRVVRQHFGTMGGRNLTLNSRQVGYVVVFVMCCSVYLVWVAL
jgi:hypothetical protein